MIMRILTIIASLLLTVTAMAQENLQKQASNKQIKKTFTTIKENPITNVKNQYRSGTCWAYATLGYLESEILRKTGRTYDLCEMFVVNRDYMDCATHYVRMHGFSQISEGGSSDDVSEVIRHYGICPETAMPAPGSLTGDSLANFNVFFPQLERTVSAIVKKDAKEPQPFWKDSVLAVIERFVGRCPESFVYEGKTYTPTSFAESLGLNLDDYVSLTSYTHHPFYASFVIESPYKWRLKPSYNIPIDELMDILDKALDAGYTVAWGGDVSGDFTPGAVGRLAFHLRPRDAHLRQSYRRAGQTLLYGEELMGREWSIQGHLVHVARLHEAEHHLSVPEPPCTASEEINAPTVIAVSVFATTDYSR